MYKFDNEYCLGVLIKRYKRFLADILLDDGQLITAHCANPGAMLGITTPGLKVMVTKNNNPKRKLAYTWETVWLDNTLIGVNTHNPNKIIKQALANHEIMGLPAYDYFKAEVKYGTNCRIDFLLTNHQNNQQCLLEVKNVHYVRGKYAGQNLAEFPDCVTDRGAKHQLELAKQIDQGFECTVLYVVQREDVKYFKIAADLDPTYSKAATYAKNKGVKTLAYSCKLDNNKISLYEPLTIID